jgi:hypothetical protein
MTNYDDDEDLDLEFGETGLPSRHIAMSCDICGFTTIDDIHLIQNHSCEIQQGGGRCEDYPCCGHEAGDCNGLRYGSDEKIKADVYRAMYDEDFAYAMERQAEYDSYWG